MVWPLVKALVGCMVNQRRRLPSNRGLSLILFWDAGNNSRLRVLFCKSHLAGKEPGSPTWEKRAIASPLRFTFSVSVPCFTYLQSSRSQMGGQVYILGPRKKQMGYLAFVQVPYHPPDGLQNQEVKIHLTAFLHTSVDKTVNWPNRAGIFEQINICLQVSANL